MTSADLTHTVPSTETASARRAGAVPIARCIPENATAAATAPATDPATTTAMIVVSTPTQMLTLSVYVTTTGAMIAAQPTLDSATVSARLAQDQPSSTAMPARAMRHASYPRVLVSATLTGLATHAALSSSDNVTQPATRTKVIQHNTAVAPPLEIATDARTTHGELRTVHASAMTTGVTRTTALFITGVVIVSALKDVPDLMQICAMNVVQTQS